MKRKDRLYQVATVVLSMAAGALWCDLARAYDVTREGDYVWACIEAGAVVSRHDTQYRAVVDCGKLVDADGIERHIEFGGLRVFTDEPPPPDEPEDPPVEEPEPTPVEEPAPPEPSSGDATATSITLHWIAPTENEDGSALTDLNSYNIFVRSPFDVINVPDATATQYTLTDLTPCTSYRVRMKAITLPRADGTAYASDFSEEKTYSTACE